MSRVVVNYHIRGAKNVGDEMCAPALYFDLGKDSKISHIQDTVKNCKVAIYGGGAIGNTARRYQVSRKNMAVLWGVGNTDRGKFSPPSHPSYPEFALRGVRDYHAAMKNKNLDWVPCVSCMSELFDNPPEPTQEVVYYGHKRMSPMGDMNNDATNFEEVISYLSKGETIVTSSYHGVYWGLLLNRKVACIPFGSKFYGFKHLPKMYVGATSHTLKKVEGFKYDGVLEEYREQNIKFWEKVKCVI